MTVDYLVQQVDGVGRIKLQNGLGSILLQSSVPLRFEPNINTNVPGNTDLTTNIPGNKEIPIQLNDKADIEVLG